MQRELTLRGVEQLRSQSSERESEVSFVTIGTRATSEIIAPMQKYTISVCAFSLV